MYSIPSVGNRHWDSAPSAHLVVLNDGGRIDLTTPRIRGTGSLGEGDLSVYRTTRFLVHRSDGMVDWVSPGGCGVQREVSGQAGEETPRNT